MSAQEFLAEQASSVRSNVKIEQTAKGPAQVKVTVYVGDTDEQMQEAKDLAIATYRATLAELNKLGLHTV